VAALASKGPASRCRLTEAQLGALVAALELGPAAYGWEDQRWTLARIAALIREMFAGSYTLRGVSYLLHRLGWSTQVPRHRAAERGEAKIAEWRDEVWPQVKAPLGAVVRGSASLRSLASR
jgi:putative transposase